MPLISESYHNEKLKKYNINIKTNSNIKTEINTIKYCNTFNSRILIFKEELLCVEL